MAAAAVLRGATSHEQPPGGRPRCRWPPLSPGGRRLAAPQHRSPPAPSRPEVRAGTAEGWDGMRWREGRPAEDRRLGPLGVLEPRLAPPRSRPCLPPALGRADCGLLPGVWSLEPSAAGARGPANPYPTHSAAAQRRGRDPSLAPSAARQVLRTWGDGAGGPGENGATQGEVVVLFNLKPPLDLRVFTYWSALPLPPPSP